MQDDTSSLVALYSALIQGGATILAVLGGFLFTTAASMRARWMYFDRESQERVKKEDEQLLARSQEARKKADSLSTDERERIVEDLERSLKESLARLATIRVTRASLADFSEAGQTLVVITVACVVLPAGLLMFLPLDPAPVMRSIFAVAAYAFALLKIAVLVVEMIRDREEERPATHTNTAVSVAVIACIVATTGIGFVPPLSSLFRDNMTTGSSSSSTPSISAPVVFATPET